MTCCAGKRAREMLNVDIRGSFVDRHQWLQDPVATAMAVSVGMDTTLMIVVVEAATTLGMAALLAQSAPHPVV